MHLLSNPTNKTEAAVAKKTKNKKTRAVRQLICMVQRKQFQSGLSSFMKKEKTINKHLNRKIINAREKTYCNILLAK